MTGTSHSLPFITVVMPVRNEVQFIGDTLNALLNQEYPPDRFEIIVADGFSEDGTRELVQSITAEHPQVRLIDNPGIRSSAGRNVGFRQGRGDIFIVVDGHCYVPNEQLLQNHVDCFAQSGAVCLARPQPLDPPGLTPFQESVAMARASRLGHGGGSLIYSDYEGYVSPVSNGAAYRREVFDQVGYVDEGFDVCEDVEFNLRVEKAGLNSFMSPKLQVKYYPRQSLQALFKQMLRYGVGRYRLFRKHLDSLGLSTLVPPAFALIVLGALPFYLAAVFKMLPLWLGLLPVFALLLYIAIVIFQSALLCLKTKARYFFFLLVIFFVIHFGLGFGFLSEAVTALPRRGK